MMIEIEINNILGICTLMEELPAIRDGLNSGVERIGSMTSDHIT